jgi:SAM-dependent methyltransferase
VHLAGGDRNAGTADPACRACGGRLDSVLNLGLHPPAGWFPPPDDPAAVSDRHPLELALCMTCGLAQLSGDGPDERDDARGAPPTSSATMSAHARRFVNDLIHHGLAVPRGRILEMASHGGHLWPFFREAGVRTTVLEASAGWADRLESGGARVIRGEVDASGEGAPELDDGGFDLIVDNYLLSHLRNPVTAVARLAAALRPGGWLVLELDHLLPTIRGLQFDAIRHGHRSYLALSWLVDFLGRHDLHVTEAEAQPVYGGALRVRARRGRGDAGSSVRSMLDEEAAAGLGRREGYGAFVAGVERVRARTLMHLEASRDTGRHVVGYGAPARGVTFLNLLAVGTDLLPYTVDRSVAKQGRVIPGVGVPIHPPEALHATFPDEVLVLAWDLAREIRAGLPSVEARGGRFLVAIPELAVLADAGLRPLPAAGAVPWAGSVMRGVVP